MAALRYWVRGVLSFTLVAAEARAVPPAPPLPPFESSAAGDLDLSIGVRRDAGEAHAETTGFIALSLPLERLAAPKLSAQLTEPLPLAEATTAPRAAPTDELTLAPALPVAELARLARESVNAALRRENLPLRARELDSLAARSKSSAILPELRLRATRSHDEALRLAPTADDPYRFSLAGGNALVLEASANWRLNRLVFADEELAVERMRLEEERTRERLTARVIEKVLAWHRALSHERAADPRLRERSALDRLEAEVELDVVTGGFFADRARKSLSRAALAGPAPPPASADPARSGGAEPPSESAPPSVLATNLPVAVCGARGPADPREPSVEMPSPAVSTQRAFGRGAADFDGGQGHVQAWNVLPFEMRGASCDPSKQTDSWAPARAGFFRSKGRPTPIEIWPCQKLAK